MVKILSRILTGFVVLLALPSFLILASWNSLPDDSLYGVKRGMENAVFLAAGKTFWARYLSVSYTERRYEEAQRLFSKKFSVAGFKLLVNQAKLSKEMVIKANDKENGQKLLTNVKKYKSNVRSKKEEAQKIVSELERTEEELGVVESDLEANFSL